MIGGGSMGLSMNALLANAGTGNFLPMGQLAMRDLPGGLGALSMPALRPLMGGYGGPHQMAMLGVGGVEVRGRVGVKGKRAWGPGPGKRTRMRTHVGIIMFISRRTRSVVDV